MRALYIASSGMAAQETNVNTISNNIANMRTTGYKRQRVNFQDMMYQNMRRAGTTTSETGSLLPAGIEIGSGVKTASIVRVMTQGTIAMTEKDYDVAIRGEGFLRVQMPDGTIAYTRDGSLELNQDGVLVTAEGYTIDPGITVPNNASDVTISANGEVQVTLPGQTAPQLIGQLQLSRFINKSGLESIGDNLFLETAASGEPITDNPGNEGFGTLLQHNLEESNVNAVTEISDLIAAQRAYEMNARVVTAADSMLQATSNLGR
jgi:flagellar basal-body rod protein FlgG